jgi:outer membrane receptor protein involved in Fe transport
MIRPARSAAATVGALLAIACAASAAVAQAPPTHVLPPVLVEAPPPVAASSDVLVPNRDFELRPQGRPADIIRLVPGLVISQHQGGGKAEQYFLRGFDADHGTDVAIFVDGMPVNLRSHAHGQGYADLHFLIPEAVRRIEAVKGPFHVELGDFATAGAVNFVTLDTVDENLAQVAGGMFGTQRYLTLVSPTRDALKTLVAVEGFITDGPTDRPQNYQRLNLFAKATASLAENLDASAWVSHMRGAWFASGEIPARAVRSGLIDRFGSIDNSEGGDTQRTAMNLAVRWRPSEQETVTLQASGRYDALNLFSNFTFFLNDPANGGGIVQRDRRWVAWADARYERRATLVGLPLTGTAGLQYRADTPRVVLSTQADRHRLARTQDVDIVEQSVSPFVRLDAAPLAWLRVVTGARGDVFSYDVKDNLHGANGRVSGDVTRAIPSWKANVILGPWYATELFANYGTGFHSNDARAVVSEPGLPALARAEGWEVGVRTRPFSPLEVSASYWALDLASELVFVGDVGTTEPRGRSRRHGMELAGKARLLDWLSLNGDITVSRARFANGDEVPLAPRLTARADLTARLPWGLSASLEMRHLADRYASEDRQQTARGYTLFDVSARYRYRSLEAFVSLENLTNTEWREAQFFFTSRLRGEPAGGVPDIHYTPGTPRAVLGGLAWRF